MSSSSSRTIKLIPNSKLHVSEPDPTWFGNKPNVKKSDSSNWTNKNWLKSRFHFNFAEYNNYKNTDYGVIRVLNDDLVQPDRGFGSHPHRNMEIITYVVDGELTHQDSMGTKETLGRGSIQYMTAGTGIVHSEHNLSKTKPLRFIQTWIVPTKSNLQPNYGSCSASTTTAMEKNKLLHLVSNVNDQTVSTPVKINQDVDGYVAMLEEGQQVTHILPTNRQAYLVCLEGSVSVNGVKLGRYDACEIHGSSGSEITGDDVVTIETTGTEMTVDSNVAHFIMYTMAAVPGCGRKDI